MTEAEFDAAVLRGLDRIGMDLDDLADCAAADDFPSLEAKKLWLAVAPVYRR